MLLDASNDVTATAITLWCAAESPERDDHVTAWKSVKRAGVRVQCKPAAERRPAGRCEDKVDAAIWPLREAAGEPRIVGRMAVCRIVTGGDR